MALTEIEFELSATQYRAMGYPGIKQGEPLTAVLETAILFPDPTVESWFVVQKEPWPARLARVAPATYAFAGQIEAAEIGREEGAEIATLLVRCGDIPLRVTCAPGEDGRLPFGVWETRYLTGISHIYGVVEDDFATAVGQSIDLTIWSFRRLILTPGDAVFGQWYESDQLAPTPFPYDRIIVEGRLHRQKIWARQSEE
ncbi:MAG: hypothetical protein R3C14_06690 [Caldilineaceae bacterium]